MIVSAGHTRGDPRDAARSPPAGLDAATPTSSMPCRRWRAASPARSGRRSTSRDLLRPDRRPPPCLGASLRVALAAKRRGADDAGHRRDADRRHRTRELRPARAGRSFARTAGSPRRTARSPAPTSTWRRRSATRSQISGSTCRRRCTWPRACPAEFLGLGHELGRIAPGYRASLVLLDDELKVRATWIDGAGGAGPLRPGVL